MTIEFKKPTTPIIEDVSYQCFPLGLQYPPIGTPRGIPEVWKTVCIRKALTPPPLALPGSDLPRVLNYLADYSGCGWWRLGAPEMLLNYNQKMIVNSLTSMVLDPKFYLSGFSAIKLQRQATPMQKEFVKLLKHLGNQLNTKIIYEVDDIVFSEGIPMFNRCRSAFTDPEIRQSIEDIMNMCDEFCVVSEYMKDYYKSKINNKKITVIPNYAPRMWFDRFYNEDVIAKNYEKNKKRPKILITGSGTHYDVGNQNNQKDDYSHVLQSIIKTRKDFQWIFKGGYPLLLKPFVDAGEMTYVEWTPLLDFAKGIWEVGAQATIAALDDNVFNRSKSFIKLTESAHLGLPFVGQDMEPYKDAWHKFNTGDEMIDQIKSIVTDNTTYMKECRKARKFGDGYWLDDHLDEHVELYTLPYGDPKRVNLIKLNPEQASK
jgi:hypothetical protein